MSHTPPATTRTLRRHPGATSEQPTSDKALLASLILAVQNLAAGNASLEVANQTLQIEARRSADQAQFRLVEEEHNLLKTYVIIQDLVRQSVRPGDTGEAFRAIFENRLLDLAHSHNFLGSNHPSGVLLNEVVESHLKPYGDVVGRVTVLGPQVHLPAQDIPSFGLALRELTTNSRKYGALSIPEGRIEVVWEVKSGRKNQARSLLVTWQEQGGPILDLPKRSGLRSKLLEQRSANAAAATTQLDTTFHNVAYRIWLPLPNHKYNRGFI